MTPDYRIVFHPLDGFQLPHFTVNFPFFTSNQDQNMTIPITLDNIASLISQQ